MREQGKNKKIISLIIILFLVMVLISGGTLAYWTWITADSEKTNVTLTITAPDMSAKLTGYTQTVNNLIPVSSCTDSTYAIKKQLTITYKNNSTNVGEILGTLSIENFTSPNGTPDSDDLSHLHYAVTTSPDNCTEEPLNGMSGIFKSTTGNLFDSEILVGPILSGTNETSMTFYLWVWLDSEYTHQNVGSEVTSDPMQNISFTLVWSGEIKNDLILPNAPVLDDGMIPVKIANNGKVTTVAKNDLSWYNYGNKQWANVVLVNEEATDGVVGSQSREYYKNNPGTPVVESDILAYFVWIPRYKYRLWYTEAVDGGNSALDTGKVHSIDIVFEKKDIPKSDGTCDGEYEVPTNGCYLTHPAFTFDDELDGIWVGKFETGYYGASTSAESKVLAVDSSKVIVKPSRSNNVVYAWLGNNMSNMFYTTLGMTDVDNIFGLTTSSDSHVMKNIEWGAVSYLSHSIYGTCDEDGCRKIYNNNNNNFMTGCGADSATEAAISSCKNQFGTRIDGVYNQSTTGNITGVFDMSGGTYELVMAFSTIDSSSYDKSGFTDENFPANKYVDLYEATSSKHYNERILGDATGELGPFLTYKSSWYNVYAYFLYYKNPWLGRGGFASQGTSAGIFSFGNSQGNAYSSGSTFRISIV